MADVIVYMKPTCPYCQKAIATLEAKTQNITIIDIVAEPEKRDEMIRKIPEGRRPTVPQIFIKGEYIGGCDDLLAIKDDDLTNKLGV